MSEVPHLSLVTTGIAVTALLLSLVSLYLGSRAMHAVRHGRWPVGTTPAGSPPAEPAGPLGDGNPPPGDRVADLERRFSELALYVQEAMANTSGGGGQGALGTESGPDPPSPVATLDDPSAVSGRVARGQPVEFDGERLRPSRSLGALGILETSSSPALLYLNEHVEVDHVAFEKWSKLFDFGTGRPYMRFRTLSPSQIRWDASAQIGDLVRRGTAEALP